MTAASGELIVLDSDQGWLYVFDQEGKALRRIGGPAGQFYHPRGLSIDRQNNLYVADTGGSRIVKRGTARCVKYDSPFGGPSALRMRTCGRIGRTICRVIAGAPQGDFIG